VDCLYIGLWNNTHILCRGKLKQENAKETEKSKKVKSENEKSEIKIVIFEGNNPLFRITVVICSAQNHGYED